MRADRLLAILLLLQTQGKMTAQRLADTLEVSRRTILRDLDALTAVGIPVYAEGGHGGGIVLDDRYRTTLTGLRENELRTLFISDNSQRSARCDGTGADAGARLRGTCCRCSATSTAHGSAPDRACDPELAR